MNLQSMTIIFVIIFLPIILISTYYIQREVDTITLQTSYDTKLIDATTDAVSAFEINTANEDLSSVSDSLRSIIEASNNVFTTTLATNLGMSGATKSKVLPYIPAIVYTLYDGYYIYSPTKQAKVLTDPNGVYVRVGDVGVKNIGEGIYQYNFYEVNKCDNDQAELEILKGKSEYTEYKEEDFGKILYFSESSDGKSADKIDCTIYPEDFNKEKKDEKESAYFATSYILKSFIPYSMRYKDEINNYDVTINYTLDNYITVYGTINGVYYSKSGYLIDFDLLKVIEIEDNNETSKEFDVSGFSESYSLNEIDDLVNNHNIKIIYNDIEISSKSESATSEHYSGTRLSDNKSAIAYYLKAAVFSNWVNKNLADIKPTNIASSSQHFLINSNDVASASKQFFSIKQNGETLENDDNLFWNYTEDSIFTTNDIWNVENTESNFYEHKRKVIKNSIQYNLNLAMATYNQGQGDEYYQMPILSEPEWDKLLSNVSVLAFMQGMPCGLKTYNNYALVTSTNNEIMANVDEIYYVPVDLYNDIYALDKGFKKGEIEIADLKSSLEGLKNNNIGVLTSQHKILFEKTIEGQTESEKEKARKIFYSGMQLSKAHKISHIETNVEIFQSFPSRELKYDKEYNPDTRNYEYDHVCNTCYDCIVNSNYNNWYEEYKKLSSKTTRTSSEDNKFQEIVNTYTSDTIDKLKKTELIAIGKIRNNTYKSCAVKTNNGLNVVDLKNQDFSSDILDSDEIQKCYEIQITIDTSAIDRVETKYMYLGNDVVTFRTGSSNTQTLVFKNSSLWNHGGEVLYNDKVIAEETNAYEINSTDENIKVCSITYKYK